MKRPIVHLTLSFVFAFAGCESSGGGNTGTGGNTGSNTGGNTGGGTSTGESPDASKNEADLQVSGSESKAVEGESTDTSNDETFGAGIAASQLSLFITGSDGTFITVSVDTSKAALPGSLEAGELGTAPVFIQMTSLTNAYASFDGSGTVTIDQCPGGAGEAVTGKFDGTKLKQAGVDPETAAEVVLDGTFNLVVAAAASPSLVCKAVPEPEPSPEPAATGSCPEKAECDGPCCPYEQCLGQCWGECVIQIDLSDPFNPKQEEGPCATPGQEAQCFDCMETCYATCEVSAACKTAALAAQACAEKAGCGSWVDEEGEACIEEHCCDELHAVF